MKGKAKKTVSNQRTISRQKLKSSLNKRPYGLLKSVGITSNGCTPGEAWKLWEKYEEERIKTINKIQRQADKTAIWNKRIKR